MTIDHNTKTVTATDNNGVTIDPPFQYTSEALSTFLGEINLYDDGFECQIEYDNSGNQLCIYSDGSMDKIDVAKGFYMYVNSDGIIEYEEDLKPILEHFNVYNGATVYTADGNEVRFSKEGTMSIQETKTGISTIVDFKTFTVDKQDIKGNSLLTEKEPLTYEKIWDFVDNLQIDYVKFDFDAQNFCDSNPELCVNGAPDLAAICDNLWQFPAEYFENTGINAMCEVDYEDACAAFPELCDSTGAFSSDICAAFPEKCDSTSLEYNPCAEDLYSCILDPEFDACNEFPELCGAKDTLSVPLFGAPANGKGAFTTVLKDQVIYSCIAEISEPVWKVDEIFSTLDYWFASDPSDYMNFETELAMGARVYASETDVAPRVIGDVTG